MQTTLGGGYTSSYVYTHLGQLWQGSLNGTGTYQYLYCNTSQPHQLTALYPTGTTCGTTSGQTQSYGASYDSWGNLTTRNYNSTTGTLTYDPQDLLVRWNGSVSNQAEWYMYDGGGSRVLRRSYDGTNITITVYAFGMEEHQYQYSGSGTTAINTNNTYYYTLGGKLLGTLSGTTTLSTTFMLSDTLGSVVASMSNTAGSAAVLGNQAYGPYGNQRYSKGSIGTNKGYTGQYNDSLTGLDYYNARYYDPMVGRFLSADTVQGNGQGMDPYAYVGGNPETYNDPTGLFIPSSGPGEGIANDIAPTNTGGGDWITPVVTAVVQGAIYLGTAVWSQWDPGNEAPGTIDWGGASPPNTAINSLIRYHPPHVGGGGNGGGGNNGGGGGWNPPPTKTWTTPWTAPQTQTGGGGGGNRPPTRNRPTVPSPEPREPRKTPQGNGPDPTEPSTRPSSLTDMGTTTLYRAVAPGELEDILRFGDYGLSPSESGKYFSFSEEGAYQFANSDFNRGIPMTMTSIDVPTSFIEEGYQFFDPGGGNDSVHFTDEMLMKMYPLSGLPKIIDVPWMP